jgi:hypothetical protein
MIFIRHPEGYRGDGMNRKETLMGSELRNNESLSALSLNTFIGTSLF